MQFQFTAAVLIQLHVLNTPLNLESLNVAIFLLKLKYFNIYYWCIMTMYKWCRFISAMWMLIVLGFVKMSCCSAICWNELHAMYESWTLDGNITNKFILIFLFSYSHYMMDPLTNMWGHIKNVRTFILCSSRITYY